MTTQSYAPTARCVHCTWTADTPRGDDLQEVRSIHELIHPGGTVLVGDEEATKRGTPVIETHVRWKPSTKPSTNGAGQRPRGYWTRERCIEALQEFGREHGRAPRQHELRSPLPASTKLTQLFGSMTAGMEAAGLTPPGRGHAGRGRKSEAVPPPATEPKVGKNPTPAPEPEPPAVEEGAEDSRKYSGSIPESGSLVEAAQLALDGLTPELALTERQAQALAIIRERAPIRSEDLGAELRELRGGRTSGAEFDASNGKAVAEALHAKGLVAYLRREGWVLAENAPKRKASSQLTEIPEWF